MVDNDYASVVDSKDFYIGKGVRKNSQTYMHHHRSYEIYFLLSGEREYFIEDRFFTVTAGDLVLIPAKVMHRTEGEGSPRFLMHFTDAFLQRFFTPSVLEPLFESIPPVFRPEPQERERILSMLNTMLAEYNRSVQEQSPLNEPLISGYLYHILLTMAHTANQYISRSKNDERVTQIIQYINENYNHITDIQQIAEHFFISKYHLCRFFRKNLDISLVTYLNTVKIREACNMIKNGCSNMTEVAILCGFNSSSYFCKVFKKEKGISPTEFRNAHKQNIML